MGEARLKRHGGRRRKAKRLRGARGGTTTPSDLRALERREARRTGAAPPVPASGRLPYLPGIDGLRALAVVAVLVYHASPAQLPGGFLGVEVFFVISGYLITSLLLAERKERRRIDLGAFWLGRARRLLPAVLVMIGLVLTYAVVALPDEVASLRQDGAAAAGYVTNWYLIFADQPYFETFGRPSLLQHLWSLAVEEQFYLLWPPLFVVLMALLPRRLMPLALLTGAACSTLLMAALYHPNVDHSRLYYGTDTRAAGLLIGAALAFFVTPGRVGGGRTGPRGRRVVDALGLGALAALACLHVVLDEAQPLLYQGGFALVALATAGVIVAAVWPGALTGRALGLRPLVWLGTRSYSVYLWHWPVFMLTRPNVDVPFDGLPLVALRLGVTLALAELSYRLVEAPVRRGVLGRAWSSLREGLRGGQPERLVRHAAAAGAALASVGLLAVSVAGAQPAAPPPYLATERVQTGALTHARLGADAARHAERNPTATLVPTAAATSTARPQPTRAHSPTPARVQAAPPIPPLLQPTRARPTPLPSPALPVAAGKVTAIGDSVMVGAADQLTGAVLDISIDAAINRQVSTGIDMLRLWKAAGWLGDTVVVHLGNNGTFTAGQFDDMMRVLGAERRVVFVNVKVPREWEGSNNNVLAEGVARYPNAVLVDWHTLTVERPDLFWEDGTHLRPEGAQLYAGLIATALE